MLLAALIFAMHLSMTCPTPPHAGKGGDLPHSGGKSPHIIPTPWGQFIGGIPTYNPLNTPWEQWRFTQSRTGLLHQKWSYLNVVRGLLLAAKSGPPCQNWSPTQIILFVCYKLSLPKLVPNLNIIHMPFQCHKWSSMNTSTCFFVFCFLFF